MDFDISAFWLIPVFLFGLVIGHLGTIMDYWSAHKGHH